MWSDQTSCSKSGAGTKDLRGLVFDESLGSQHSATSEKAPLGLIGTNPNLRFSRAKPLVLRFFRAGWHGLLLGSALLFGDQIPRSASHISSSLFNISFRVFVLR